IELGEELVESLFALVVRSKRPESSSRSTDRVDLIDENDAQRTLLRLFEELAHTRCPESDEHLHELTRVQRKEWDIRLSRNRPRQERLSGTGWPDQEKPTRNAPSEGAIAPRLLQKIDDLDELVFRFVDPSNIVETHRFLQCLVVDLGLAAQKAERPARPP